MVASSAAVGVYFLKPEWILHAEKTDDSNEHGSISRDADALPSRAKLLALIERLGAVQDRITHGDRTALGEQSDLLAEIGTFIRYFDEKDWGDYGNVRTSLVYVLTGGDPAVLKPVLNANNVLPADRTLAQGVMAFAMGHQKTARRAMDGVDPRSLDVALIGMFALARASLYTEKDPQQAIELFDEARLASPHTAIDEAAARREIPLLINAGELDRASALTVDYMVRFGRSVYASKLFYDFAEAISVRPEFSNVEAFERLAFRIGDSDATAQAQLFLEVANAALVRGKLALAKISGELTNRLDGIAPDLKEKAQLYIAAADAPSDRASAALGTLRAFAKDKLSDDDNEIRGVADYIARTVTSDGRDLPVPPGSPPLSEAANKIPSVADALQQANSALKRADEMTRKQ